MKNDKDKGKLTDWLTEYMNSVTGVQTNRTEPTMQIFSERRFIRVQSARVLRYRKGSKLVNSAERPSMLPLR